MPLFCRFSPHFFSFSWILVTRILHHWKGMASSLIFWGFGNQNHHPTPPKRDRISTFQDIWFNRKPPEFAGTISGTKLGYRKWREQYLTALYQSSVLLFGWWLTDWRTCPENDNPAPGKRGNQKPGWTRQTTNDAVSWQTNWRHDAEWRKNGDSAVRRQRCNKNMDKQRKCGTKRATKRRTRTWNKWHGKWKQMANDAENNNDQQ